MLARWLSLGSAFGGLLLLMAAGILPWGEIPLVQSDGQLTMEPPAVARSFRLLCPIVAVVVLGLRLHRGEWSIGLCRCVAAWLMLLLSYPYFATLWCPDTAAQAAWLQLQHENLTWLGGDICTSAEFAESPLKQSVYPVDPPRRLMVCRIPDTLPWDLQMANMIDLLDWLGYTEGFCQFSCKGWFAAVIGTVLILMAACVVDRRRHRERIIASLRMMLSIATLLVAVAWSLPFAAGVLVSRASELVHEGRYAAALVQLRVATQYMPVLEHDTSYVAQTGRLGYLLGMTTPEARLYAANRLEAAGRMHEARQSYRLILEDPGAGPPARREACRALLRDAIHALNAGQYALASATLDQVLQSEPTNLKANYTMQLVCLRTGRYAELDCWVEQLHKVYAAFQAPMKRAVLAEAHAHRLAATLESNDPVGARKAYLESQRP